MKKTVLITFGLLLVLLRATTVQADNRRYISLTPATTEILFALGLNREIVGVSTFCNYPPEAGKKEKIGSFSDPNIEKIISLNPDIVFCTGLEQATTVTKLRQLNLNVFVSDPSSIGELYQSISDIGDATNRVKEALTLVTNIKNQIRQIQQGQKLDIKVSKPKVFIEIWNEPLITAGKNSLVNELIETAGGINIAANTNKAYANFSAEQVIRKNPDCIIATYMSGINPGNVFKNRLGWSNIAAVKNNRIYCDINPDLLLRPGPRIVEGIKELHKRFYQNE